MTENKTLRAGKTAAFLAVTAAIGALSAGCFRSRPVYYSQPPVVIVHHYGGGYGGYGGGPVIHVHHYGSGYGGGPVIVHHYHR